MTTSPARKSRQTAGQERADNIRGWGNVLSLWRLCGNAACRRAHGCRGNGTACFRQNYPLLPEGVRAWFEGLGEAQKENYSFDQAIVWLDSLGLMNEFHNWCAAVEGHDQQRCHPGSREAAIRDP